jgi:diguanylate cyclase (GGDEF)-like protein
MASSDLSKPAARSGVARRVYFAAAAMIIAFVATVVFVIELSSREADKFALDAEMRSTRLEFDRLSGEVIREFSDTSYWDDAVEAFADNDPDMEFVEEEIVDWLLPEFDFAWTAAVREDDETAVAVIGEQVLERPENLGIVQANADLIRKARELYLTRRVRTGDGFVVPAGHGSVIEGVQATAYRMWNGAPGLVIAQVILPETADYAIAEGDATVLVGFKPMTPQIIADVGDRLGLRAPHIVPFDPRKLPISHIDLPNDGAAPELAFQWHPRAPRPAILGAVAPFAAVLCALICAATIYIVTRHGRALKALAASEERNRLMAAHDALTGLPNRHQFDAVFEDLIAKSDPVAVICIDLDRFKVVNDTHGHDAGDAVLRAVAKRFRDRLGDHGIVARIGGDEFIAAVTKQVDRDYLQWLGDSLVQDASQPVTYHGHELVIGASVGIAIWPRDGEAAREVITAADQFLYRSKGEGRGRTTIADAGKAKAEKLAS